MAHIPWPSTLPNPSANGFSLTHKQMSNTLTFASGRPRVARNRQISLSRFIVNIEMNFLFTLEEYGIFANFYDANWKRFRPTGDKISFTFGSLPEPWIAYPTSDVKCIRNENTWQVSFAVEAFVPYFAFSYTNEQKDPAKPLWPQNSINGGASFSRVSRDVNILEDNLLLSRSIAKDDRFVKGTITLRPETLDDVFFFHEWWRRFLLCGALPFRIPSNVLDLGPINGIDPSAYGFFYGKVISAPSISFDGYFGTVSVSVVLFSYYTTHGVSYRLVTDTGAIFTTGGGQHLIGVM